MGELSSFFSRKPQRIVTGQREDGSSYFVSVEEVDEDARGIGSHRIWAIDDLPVELPFLASAMPDSEALRNTTAKPARLGEVRIHLHYMQPNTEGTFGSMHWHDTFDIQWLMAGEMTIALDGDDREVTLRPGDAVVQHGTNHAWRVGPDGCVLAIFMMGARRVAAMPPAENHRPV